MGKGERGGGGEKRAGTGGEVTKNSFVDDDGGLSAIGSVRARGMNF
jgi:hypothetical protein